MSVVMNELETNPQWIRVPYDHSLPYLWVHVIDQENGHVLKKLLLGYPFFLSNRVGHPYSRDRPGGMFGLLLSWPFTASQPKAFLALSSRDQTCHTTAAVASIDVLGQAGSE